MGDVTRGKKLFIKFCANCHTHEKRGRSGIGPNLFEIFGKTCGCKSCK